MLRSGQRQGADQEPPSARLSEGRPGYLVGSLLHLHRHPAPTTATPPTDIRVTAIRVTVTRLIDLQPTVIRPTHNRAMGTQVIRVLPVTSVPRLMDTRADLRPRVPGYGYPSHSEYPAEPGSPAYGYQGDAGYPSYSGPSPSGLGQPTYLVPPGYGPQTDLGYPPYSGSPGDEDPRESGEAPLPPSPGYGYQSPPSYPPFSFPDYRS